MSKEQRQPNSELTLEHVANRAVDALLKDGYHVTAIIAEGNRNRFVAQVTNIPPTHEERAKQLFFMGFQLARSNQIGTLQQVFHIAEAWLSTATKDTPPRLPPSQDPKRKEVMVVSSLHVSREKASGVVYEMIRDKKRRLREVKPLDAESSISIDAPLLEAFVLGFFFGDTGRR